MSRAATVPPTKKLIILRGATDFPGPREQLDRPIPRFQTTSSFDLANDPSLMIHPYCTACLRVVSIPPIVREHLCPLTTVTYEGYFLPSFSLPPDSSYHLFLSLSLSLSNLHRSRTRRFSKIPIFSFSSCIIVDFVSKM